MKRILSLFLAVVIMSCTFNVKITKAGSISISMDSPSNGATFTVGDSVSLRASLSASATSDEEPPDYNYVRFFVKNSPSQSGYLWQSGSQKSGTVIDTWNTSGYSAGTYHIYAVVFDYNNYKITDDYISVTLQNQSHGQVVEDFSKSASISVTSPASGGTYNIGDNVSLKASISGSGYSYSRFFVKNSPSQSGYLWQGNQLNGSSVSDTWNTNGYSAGTYYIFGVVFDGSHYSIDNNYISVTLKEKKPTAYASVNVTTPSSSSSYTIGDSVSLKASVSGSGYSYSRFFVKNSPSQTDYLWNGGQKSGASISDTWNTNGYKAGTYYIFGVVFDSSHYKLAENYVTVTLKEKEVEKPTITQTTIKITSNNNGNSYNPGDTVNLSAAVGGTDYSYARFFVKNSPTQSDYIVSGNTKTGANVSDTVNTKNYAAGTYYIFAVAFDKNNMKLAEDMITININAIQTKATVKVSEPSDSSSFTVGDKIEMSASISGSGYEYGKFFVKTSPSQSSFVAGDSQKKGSTITDTWDTSGFAAGTYYIFAAAFDSANNSLGNSYVTVKLNARQGTPIVNTLSATNITTNSATISGEIKDTGGRTIIRRAFCYGTSEGYLPKEADANTSGNTFSVTLTELQPNTTYYYKAIADNNSNSTGNGLVLSFTTKASDIAPISKDEINNIKTNDIVKQRFKDVTAEDIQKFLEKRNSKLKDKNFGQKFNMDTKNYFGYSNSLSQSFVNYLTQSGKSIVNEKSPADIIYQVSKENDCNPVLILATLDKEQGLIDSTNSFTDTQLQARLNAAMGYLESGEKFKCFIGQLTGATYTFGLYANNHIYFKDAYEKYTPAKDNPNALYDKFMNSYYIPYEKVMIDVINERSSSSDQVQDATPSGNTPDIVQDTNVNIYEPSGWAIQPINEAKSKGLIQKDYPYKSVITREEVAEIAVSLYESLPGDKPRPSGTSSFNDTTNENVIKAANLGILNGYGDGKFDPDGHLQRQQLAVIIKNVFDTASNGKIVIKALNVTKFRDAGEIADWAYNIVEFISFKGVMQGYGDGRFGPTDSLTYEQAITALYKAYEAYPGLNQDPNRILEHSISYNKDSDKLELKAETSKNGNAYMVVYNADYSEIKYGRIGENFERLDNLGDGNHSKEYTAKEILESGTYWVHVRTNDDISESKQIVVENDAESKFVYPVLEPGKNNAVTYFIGDTKTRYKNYFNPEHLAKDYGSATGSDIMAVYAGTVYEVVESNKSYGNRIILKHIADDGTVFYSLYAHLSKINVRKGQSVRASDVIGKMGSSGNSTAVHLHIAVWKGNASTSPEQIMKNCKYDGNESETSSGKATGSYDREFYDISKLVESQRLW